MARGRFLAKTISTDKRLNSLSVESQFLFLMAIPHLDRDGLVLYGDGPEFWAAVLPRRYDMLENIPALVQEWIDKDLVIKYEDARHGGVLFFLGFQKNQKGFRYDREEKSQFAPPPGYVRKKDGLHPEDADNDEKDIDGSNPDGIRSESGVNPEKVHAKVKYKYKEKEKEKVKSATDQNDDSKKRIDEFTTYPPPPPPPSEIPLIRLYMDASGETGRKSERWRAWFDDITSRYSREDCIWAFDKLRDEIATGKLNGSSKWERIIYYLENIGKLKNSPAEKYTVPDLSNFNWAEANAV